MLCEVTRVEGQWMMYRKIQADPQHEGKLTTAVNGEPDSRFTHQNVQSCRFSYRRHQGRAGVALLLGTFLLLGGCAAARDVYGVTSADEGVRTGVDTIEYHLTHPGLDIVIRDKYSADLLPIETTSRSSPAPLRHTVNYGIARQRNVLEIDGKFSKTVTLNSVYYGKVWTGELLVDRDRLYLNGKRLLPVDKPGLDPEKG